MALRFGWYPRTPSTDKWEDDPRYEDNWGRGAVVDNVRNNAELTNSRLRSETPEASWVVKTGEDAYRPCHQFTDGARAAWIWWAE